MAGEQQQQTQTQEQRDYSAAELERFVADGTITQAQSNQIWATQVQKNATKVATETATQIIESDQRLNAIDSSIRQYADLMPEVRQEGSPARQRVLAEYKALVANGAPEDLSTEYAALRAVFGPVERVKAHKEGRAVRPDYFGDTTGGQRLTPAQRKEEDTWGKLDQRVRAHYDDLIRKRIYPDRKAALAELDRSAKRRAGVPLQ